MYLRDNFAKVLEEPGTIVPLKKEADLFSLESLVAWLETKDPAQEYDMRDTAGCLIAQYVPGRGYSVKLHALIKSGNYNQIAHVAYGSDLNRNIQTFGAALTRAQAALERLS